MIERHWLFKHAEHKNNFCTVQLAKMSKASHQSWEPQEKKY